MVNAISLTVGRPCWLEPTPRQPPDRLSRAAHDEDSTAVAARSEGDALAVRRERRLIVIVVRVGRQVDWRLTGRALEEDVSVALGVAAVHDPLAVRRQAGKPLES